jgi:spiro-SPASM protein
LKTDIIIYLHSGIEDSALDLNGLYAPKLIEERFALKKYDTIRFSVPSSYEGNLRNRYNTITRTNEDDLGFWKSMINASESDNFIRVFADAPFIDIKIVDEMLQAHENYLAEFTYSENLPLGCSVEILSRDVIEQMPDTQDQSVSFSEIIKKNINQFDVELYYHEPDIRHLRLQFLMRHQRDRAVMKNIYSIRSSIPSYSEIFEILKTNPAVMYVGPSYLEIELTGECDCNCIFCYRETLSKKRDAMTNCLFSKILDDMSEFCLPYTVCLGGSGEPLMHPNFYEILERACSDQLIERVIVETNGIYADANYRNFINSSGSKIITIINNNAIDKDSYMNIHGRDFFDVVQANVIALAGVNERTYLQLMKINETGIATSDQNKEYCDIYYDKWESHKIPIIFQKQNTYLGRLKDRRYSDLSPAVRNSCCHLRHDICVLSDGTVTFCKQDIDADSSPGNCSNESIKSIWEKRREKFTADFKGSLAIRPDCSICDEWYTFNF